MGGQVPLQLGQGREIQTTLHTYVLLAFLVLQLMGTKLAGVSKTSATHSAAGEADKACQRVRIKIAQLKKQKAMLQSTYLYGFTSLCCIMCLFRWLV